MVNPERRTECRPLQTFTRCYHPPGSDQTNQVQVDSVADPVDDTVASGHCHPSIPTPAEWYCVADPDAVPTIHQGGTQATQTAFASIPAYDPITVIKAFYFGKDFLRMAGIVQMLHALQPPYDKYPYAHPKRVRLL